MIDGDASVFIYQLFYEDNDVLYNNEHYFFNGCQTKMDGNGNILNVSLDVYNLTKNTTVFSIEKKSSSECIAEFEKAKLWDNRNFWEVEKAIEWVDC